MADTNAALRALSQALKLEREGRAFYLKAAEATLNAQGRAMFESLADDERRHAEMVERQLHALEGEGRYVVIPDLRVEPIDLGAKLFPPERRAVENKVGHDPDALEALHVALEAEIRSYDLYRQAAAETEDPAGQSMYRWLAAAEMGHFNLLMTNYQAMVELGGWV